MVVRESLPNEIASDPDVIEPSEKVISPISDPESNEDTPALNVPVVDKFSLPNDILPLSSVMDPSESVNSPTVEADEKLEIPAESVPVVDKFSSPKEIFPPVSVIDPSEKVRLPIVDVPPADMVPLVTKFSSSNDIVPLSSSIAISPFEIFKFAIKAASSTSILLQLPVAGLFTPISVPSILPPSILMFSRF